MRPDRMGRSKWQKVLPWHYTAKRKRSRQAAREVAVLEDWAATIGKERVIRAREAIAATGMTMAEAVALIEESKRTGVLKALADSGHPSQ